MADYEVWLCKDTGERLELISDFVQQMSYVKTANAVGSFTVSMTPSIPRSILLKDRQVQIWRGVDGASLTLDMLGLLNNWQYRQADGGKKLLVLGGPDINDLLARRIVAYDADDASSTVSAIPADDAMKDIVLANLGTGAVTARQIAGLAIAPDLSGATAISKSFAWRNVLSVLQGISKQSKTDGAEVFFEIKVVGIGSDFVPSLYFTTQIGQPRNDKTWSEGKSNALIFGEEWGNIANPILEFDYYNEKNYVYVAGQGEGSDRDLSEVSASTSVSASTYGRREAFKDARNVDLGDSAALVDAANELISEKEFKTRFSADLLDTEVSRYGIDWFWGDKITVAIPEFQASGIVRTVSVSVNSSGKEIVKAGVQVEL